MDKMEFSGKTVEDALTEALVQLGMTSDQVEYEVIEKGSTGFLGFNSKLATIRVTVKESPKTPETPETPEITEISEISENSETYEASGAAESSKVPKKAAARKTPQDPEERVREFLGQVFGAMHMEVDIQFLDTEEENTLSINLEGDDMGVLIGKRGQTLDALQYLTNLAVNRDSDTYMRVKMDTENYRERRQETLENLARNLAYKVKRTKKPMKLEPMNPFERRVIHCALQGDRYVETHSEGEEPYRYVVITLKK